MLMQGVFPRINYNACQRYLVSLRLTRLRVPNVVLQYWPSQAVFQAFPLLKTYSGVENIDLSVRRACWAAEQEALDLSLDWFSPEQKLRVDGYAAIKM